jgi:hypothetical protein
MRELEGVRFFEPDELSAAVSCEMDEEQERLERELETCIAEKYAEEFDAYRADELRDVVRRGEVARQLLKRGAALDLLHDAVKSVWWDQEEQRQAERAE